MERTFWVLVGYLALFLAVGLPIFMAKKATVWLQEWLERRRVGRNLKQIGLDQLDRNLGGIERALKDEDSGQLTEEVKKLQRDLWERYRDKSRYPDPERYYQMIEQEQDKGARRPPTVRTKMPMGAGEG